MTVRPYAELVNRLRSTLTPARLAWVGLGLVVLLSLVAALSLVSFGAVDTRFASAFSGDEEFIGNGVARMLTRPSLSYGFWWYPGFYMMSSATHALLLLATGVPLATAALLAPRVVAALAYGATILATGLLSFQLAGRMRAALFTALWVATSPAFFEYGITAHPDTLQLALLSGSLWLLVVAADSPDRRYLLGGAAMAGLAFVTKYAGAFLVPVVGGVAVYSRVRHAAPGSRRRALRAALLEDSPRAALAFLAATVLGAPQFWTNLKAYAMGVSTHSRNISYGYFVRETAPGWHWLELLAAPELMGTALAALIVLGLAVVILAVARERRSLAAPPAAPARLLTGPTSAAGFVVVLAFVGLYVGFLVWHSRMFEPRYLYPVVPALYALVAAALSGPTIGSRVRALAVTAGLALALVTLIVLPERAASIVTLASERVGRAAHPCLEVGAWLTAHVSTDTPIAYDHYTYVPPAFERTADTWGMTDATARELDARVVITTERIRERYNPSVDPDTWRHGREQFLASFAFYRDVEAGGLADYTLAAAIPGCHGTRIYWRGAGDGARHE